MALFQKCFFWFWTGPFTYLIFWIILIFFQALQHRDGNNYDIFSEMLFLVLDWSLYIFGLVPLSASLLLLYKFKLKPKPVKKLQ